jgi:hypothetical protein
MKHMLWSIWIMHKDRVWFTPCEDSEGSSLYNSEEVWEKYDDFSKSILLFIKK